ncbi:hypothetical protein Tco_0946347 [Tanacetum coccineum]
MCHKTTVASDTSIDFQIDFFISIGETVIHWFTLIVLSALRRSDNENMLSRSSWIRRYLKMEVKVKDIFKRQCMAIAANASNYKIDSLQIRALVKENSCKTDNPSCSSDEQMMDLISEKEEKFMVKETYSFRPQTYKTSYFEKIIQNPNVQDPVKLQILTMNELYSLPSTGIRYPLYHVIQLVIVNDKDNNMKTFRKLFHGFSRERIRIRRAIGLRIILTTMETTLKRDFRTYGGESKFSPVMISPAKKSPLGAIMYLQQRMKMIEIDLDCVNNTEEAINKWKTALGTAVAINKMDIDSLKGFLDRTILKSALRFWQNISQSTKQTIIGTDNNLENIITRAVEALRLEFCGEGNIIKDAATVQKYSTTLIRLQLNLDCVNNTEEAIDKWETALRTSVAINEMDIDT